MDIFKFYTLTIKILLFSSEGAEWLKLSVNLLILILRNNLSLSGTKRINNSLIKLITRFKSNFTFRKQIKITL